MAVAAALGFLVGLSPGTGLTGSGNTVLATAASAGGALTNVTAAWVAITANQAPVMMASEGGYFARQALAVDLRYIAGSATAMAALLSGEVQFVQVAGTAVVSAAAAGAQVRMVAGWVNKPVFLAMTTPAITEPSQLKGTTWAVTRTGNADYFSLLDMLKHFGLRPQDVTIINGGSTQGQIAAVASGYAQGVVVSPPNNVTAEEEAGMHQFFDMGALGVDEQNVGLAVTAPYARAKSEVVRRFIAACIEGIHRFKTDRAFAEGVMRKYLKYQNPRVLAAGYTAYVDLFTQVPYPTVPGLQRVIAAVASTNGKAASLKAADLIDRSAVDALVKSGFIDKIYAQ